MVLKTYARYENFAAAHRKNCDAFPDIRSHFTALWQEPLQRLAAFVAPIVVNASRFVGEISNYSGLPAANQRIFLRSY